VNTVLGVDIGTTSAKAAAFAVDGRELRTAEVAYPLLEPEPDQAVQDPDEVVAATLAAIREAAGGLALAGVAFSGAMHSLVALDEDDRPLTPLVTWADNRAAEQAERLRAEHPELHARTGTPLHPMAPLPKLVWFREHEPALFARARRWVDVKALVLARLTGRWMMDHSIASGTGLLNLERLDWDAEALSLAGVEPDRLPRLVPTTEVLPATAELDVPVVVGAADGPLANVGVGAVRPGVAACSIGTSGALRLVVENAAVDPAHRLFCYALTPGRWVSGGAINNGGSVLQWAGAALAPDLGEHSEAELIALAAEVPPGSEGLIMLPYLFSERAPHWSPLPRGAYVGLTHAHRRGHLIRAALEGVCQQLALVLASMRDAGYAVREVRATGGFARSRLWRQILADALGMPIGFPAGHEGSAFGAALLGMEALGLVDSIDVAADLLDVEDVVEPDPDGAATLAADLPLFAGVYEALVPTFRALRSAGPPRR
jgi:gluconokinase